MDDTDRRPLFWMLAGAISYVLIVAIVPAWMLTNDPRAGLDVLAFLAAVCGPGVGASVIYLIVRRINRRDDPTFTEQPPSEG